MAGFLRQSTASQPRALGPFIDDTDFVTPLTGLTIANTDVKLVVNGGASADKNSGGGTHRANGVYGFTFDATDTATVGEVEVSILATGALIVFDKFTIVEEAVYDALFVASAPGYVVDQPVNLTKISGDAQSATDLKDFADAGYDPSTNKVQGVVLTDTTTTLTNDPTGVGTLLTRLGTPSNLGGGATVAANLSDIEAQTDDIGVAGLGLSAIPDLAGVTTLLTRLGTPSNLGGGATVAANLSDIEGQTDDIGTAGAGLTALATAAELAKVPKSDGTATWNATALAAIQTEANDALVANHLDHLLAVTYDPASKPGVADALLNELVESDAGVARYTANALEQAPTGGSAPTVDQIADAVWDEATAGHTTSGTFGEQLKTDVDAILVDTAEIGVAGAGLTAADDATLTAIAALNNLSSAQAQTAAAAALTAYDPPTHAELTAGLASADDATLAAVAALVIPTAAQNAAALMDLSNGVETGLTPRQALRLIAAALAGKVSGAATTTVVIRNAVADSKARITATVTADGDRSAVTTDLT